VRVYVNGESVELDEEATVHDAVAKAGFEPDSRGVAVALDGEVVPRGELASTRLEPEQRIEVVAAIQGGRG
jgi:sulfur carrier protein